MAKHTHHPIASTERGYGHGIATPRCRKEDSGKACSNSGSHSTVMCRCGALGVMCAQYNRIHWRVGQ